MNFKSLQEVQICDARFLIQSYHSTELFKLFSGHEQHEGVQHATEVALCQNSIVIIIKLVEGTPQTLQRPHNEPLHYISKTANFHSILLVEEFKSLLLYTEAIEFDYGFTYKSMLIHCTGYQQFVS